MRKIANSKNERGCLLNNAFTLVELLGVLIILAVIALITFPIVDSVIKNGREESYNRTVESIIEAASNYSTVGDLGYSTEKKALYLEDIKKYGLLDQSIINPVTEEGTMEITSVEYERLEKPIKVYNFEVEDEHTYLVTKYSILVHNAGSRI